jgi:hypothetical protein
VFIIDHHSLTTCRRHNNVVAAELGRNPFMGGSALAPVDGPSGTWPKIRLSYVCKPLLLDGIAPWIARAQIIEERRSLLAVRRSPLTPQLQSRLSTPTPSLHM